MITKHDALAEVGRAGRRVHNEVRREQYAFARQRWWLLVLLAALCLAPNAISLFAGSSFTSGVILGLAATCAVLLPSAFVVLVTGTAPRLMGGDAERWTAEELVEIQRFGYRVIHHSGLHPGDIDHVLIGPGGVFVIETKWSSLDWDLSKPNLYLDRALGQVRRESTSMRLNLKRFGEPKVTPVLVVWGAASKTFKEQGVPVRRLEHDTLVMPGSALKTWSMGLGRGALTSAQVEQIYSELAEHTLKRDRLEPAGPRTIADVAIACARVAGTTYAALLTAFPIGRTPTITAFGIVLGAGAAAFALRRVSGWRVAGTAALAVEGLLLLGLVVELVAGRL